MVKETMETTMVTRTTQTASRGDANPDNIQWEGREVDLSGLCDLQFVTMLPSHVPTIHLLYEFAARKRDFEATSIRPLS
jgi:hypothetical protein